MAASARSIAIRHSRGGGPGRTGMLVLGAGAAVWATGRGSSVPARVTATPSRKPTSSSTTAATVMSRSTRSNPRRGRGSAGSGSGRSAGTGTGGSSGTVAGTAEGLSAVEGRERVPPGSSSETSSTRTPKAGPPRLRFSWFPQRDSSEESRLGASSGSSEAMSPTPTHRTEIKQVPDSSTQVTANFPKGRYSDELLEAARALASGATVTGRGVIASRTSTAGCPCGRGAGPARRLGGLRRLDPAPDLERRRAQVGQLATVAAGVLGGAHLAPEPDQPVREDGPLVDGDQPHQVLLDLDGVVVPGQPQPAGEPPDVGVDHHALVAGEEGAEHHVGGLAADPWQLHQLVHGPGYLAVVVLEQVPGGALDRLGLVAEEAGRAEEKLQLLAVGAGQVGDRRVAAEQLHGHLVDDHIGRLRRQDGRHQQLPRRAVGEGGGHVRVAGGEALAQLGGAGGPGGLRLAAARRGPGNLRGVPRLVARGGPGNPKGVPRWIGGGWHGRMVSVPAAIGH